MSTTSGIAENYFLCTNDLLNVTQKTTPAEVKRLVCLERYFNGKLHVRIDCRELTHPVPDLYTSQEGFDSRILRLRHPRCKCTFCTAETFYAR